MPSTTPALTKTQPARAPRLARRASSRKVRSERPARLLIWDLAMGLIVLQTGKPYEEFARRNDK